MDTPFDRLVIPPILLEEMIAHARAELPNECCGVLVGKIANGVGSVTRACRVRNDRASPNAYFTNARDLLAVHRSAREMNAEWLAIYHSHPTSAAIPSRTDLANNTYGETIVHLILGLAQSEPDMRGWWLGEQESRPAIVEFASGNRA